jgi:hypothetical protein
MRESRVSAADKHLDHPTEPGLEQWRRHRAERLGMSREDLRESDIRAVARAAYPTPECLDPLEVEQFLATELPETKRTHVNECAMCAALVEVANPPRAFFESVLRPLAIQSPMEAVAADKSRFLPVVATGAIAVVVCFSSVGLWIYHRQDALLSELLRDQALNLLIQVAICGAVLIGVSVFASRTILSHHVRLIGGVAIVIMFFCAVTFFSLRDFSTVMAQHTEMTATQVTLMIRLAKEGSQATVVSEEAPGNLPGRLVAEKNGSRSFDIKWDKSDEARDKTGHAREPQVAKIYACKIQRDNDALRLCTNADVNLTVAATAADPRIRNGEDVLALMPDNTSSISKVFPLQAAYK